VTGQPAEKLKSTGGFGRLIKACGYSWAGLKHAVRKEAAIRQELAALAILVPVSIALPVSPLEHLLLVLSMMLVVVVEFLNSAIEAVVDRVSTEIHPLAGQAKDMGSAAVGLAVLMAGLCWVVIAGPPLLRWMRG
jgi:diacylglycerol kinase (ATP)